MDIRLNLFCRECSGVPTKLQGFYPPLSKDHRCSPKLVRNTLLTKGNLISHYVVADAGQFVAQCFGGKTCIGLSNLAVIVSSELLIMPTAQLSGFSECPTQVTITVFPVAMPLAFTVG